MIPISDIPQVMDASALIEALEDSLEKAQNDFERMTVLVWWNGFSSALHGAGIVNADRLRNHVALLYESFNTEKKAS